MLARLLQGLWHLVSPRVCRVCGCSLTAKEEVLCLGCLLEVPRTYEHLSDFNEIHRRLGHHVSVDRAAGWFHYKKDTAYAQLLIDSKYRDMPYIDLELGRICATELAADHFFDGMDVLVPMPMHWSKQLMRGYNQAAEICRGISEATGIPMAQALKAVKGHGVQSRHSRTERYARMAGTLDVRLPSAVSGRHVLLVDDIITSGASLSEALRALSGASPRAISVLGLGLTQRLG